MPIVNILGLVLPTEEEHILSASGDDSIILWRGTTVNIANSILVNRSAGGSQINIATSAPSTSHVVAYVGGFSTNPIINQLKNEVCEYTSNSAVAVSFSRGALVVIKIKKKYLTQGSVAEQGWLVNRSAPIILVRAIPRGGSRGRNLPDAS